MKRIWAISWPQAVPGFKSCCLGACLQSIHTANFSFGNQQSISFWVFSWFHPSGKAAWRQSAQSRVPSSRPSWLSVQAACSLATPKHSSKWAFRLKRDTSFSSQMCCSSPRPSKSVFLNWQRHWSMFDESEIIFLQHCVHNLCGALFLCYHSLHFPCLLDFSFPFSQHIIISQPIKSIWSLAQIKAPLANRGPTVRGSPPSAQTATHRSSKIET